MADAEDAITDATNEGAANEGATNEGATFFSDKGDVLRLIADVVALEYSQLSDIAANAKTFGARYEVLLLMLNKYQEQPLLIAPSLPQLLQPLVDTLVTATAALSAYELAGGSSADEGSQAAVVEGKDDAYEYSSARLNDACKIIQLLCKVRGFKHVSKLLPHEVHHLEPCLYALLQQTPRNFGSWETRYVLLLWLNILCLIPFDICTLDSTLATFTSSAYTYNAREIKSSKLVVLILDRCDNSIILRFSYLTIHTCPPLLPQLRSLPTRPRPGARGGGAVRVFAAHAARHGWHAAGAIPGGHAAAYGSLERWPQHI